MQMRSGGKEGEETENPHKTLQLCFRLRFPVEPRRITPEAESERKEEA